MKISIHRTLLATMLVLVSAITMAQTALAPDQNPDFAVSRTKYMKMADSINSWHSTTEQDTYKAIDFLADRAEAKANRREFRRQLRMERARNSNYSFDFGVPYYNNYNQWPYRNYRSYNRYNRYNRSGGGFYINPWSVGLGYWWR